MDGWDCFLHVPRVQVCRHTKMAVLKFLATGGMHGIILYKLNNDLVHLLHYWHWMTIEGLELEKFKRLLIEFH